MLSWSTCWAVVCAVCVVMSARAAGGAFCDVKYVANVTDPGKEDAVVEKYFYDKVLPSLVIRTEDCINASKAYVCAFYFPKLPYCLANNGICRNGCLGKIAACGANVEDSLNSCFGGNLFVEENYSYGCTPMNLNYSCVQPTPDLSSFCQPAYKVVSSPTQRNAVWIALDNTTAFRYNNFISSGIVISDLCKATIKDVMCHLYFSPCGSDGKYINPRTQVLPPLCLLLSQNCPAIFAKKLCTFVPYTPPDPTQCTFNQPSFLNT